MLYWVFLLFLVIPDHDLTISLEIFVGLSLYRPKMKVCLLETIYIWFSQASGYITSLEALLS